MSDRLPFHESIIGAIRNARTIAQMRLIDYLINQTKIPKNHDEIARAWLDQIKLWPQLEDGDSFKYGVPYCLQSQKREAEAEAQRKREAELREIAADAREDCN